MKWQNITVKDLVSVVDKISLQPTKKGRAPHPAYWYYLDGKKTLRVTLPNVHGGSGSLSTGFIKQIRNNLKLTLEQLEDLVDCPLTAEDFEVIIRSKVSRHEQ